MKRGPSWAGAGLLLCTPAPCTGPGCLVPCEPPSPPVSADPSSQDSELRQEKQPPVPSDCRASSGLISLSSALSACPKASSLMPEVFRSRKCKMEHEMYPGSLITTNFAFNAVPWLDNINQQVPVSHARLRPGGFLK